MRVAVIGCGISGTAAAFYLSQQNAEVDIYESADQIGGRAGSELLPGRRVDFGGKNIGSHYYRFREFCKEYGNPEFEYFGINTSQLINGRIVGLSREGAKWYNLLKLVHLCGIDALIRIYPHIRAILDDRNQGFLDSDYFRTLSERFDNRSLAEFVTKRCVENIIRPITIRMNGAEPEECYPGNFGSNLALAVDSYEQLTEGMYGLFDQFAASHMTKNFRLFTRHQVTSVESEAGMLRLGYRHQEQVGYKSYDRVISALPAHQLASLLDRTLPEAAKLLRQIHYYPVGVAIVKYRDDVFLKERRAMIFDRTSVLSNAGAYGLNDLDLVRYTFSGKASRIAITEHSSPEHVIGLGEKTASPYFNIKGNRKEAFVYRYYSKGLCAYSSRHHLLLESLDRQLGRFSGFGSTGDYRRGASIEACFRAASECVDKVIGDRT